MSFSKMLLALGAASCFFPSAQAADPITVPVPCGDTGLRSCDFVLHGGGQANNLGQSAPLSGSQAIGSAAGTPALAQTINVNGMISQLNQRIQQHVDDMYIYGVDPNPTTGTSSKPGGPAIGPVCDLSDSPFVLKNGQPLSENKQNHLGNSCGDPLGIKVIGHRKSVMGTEYVASLNTYVSKDPGPQTAGTQKRGSLEDAYINGALVQAISCNYSPVVKEIDSTHQLVVRDIDGIQSPCRAMATDYLNYTNKFNTTVKQLQSQLTSQQNISDILNCQNTWDTSSNTNGKTPDRGALRQSAQHLCTARVAIESTFTQLAACEIFARGQGSYLNTIGSPSNYSSLMTMIQNDGNTACQTQCQSTLNDIDPSDQAMTSCAQSCYRQYVPKLLKKYFEKFWPKSCTTASAKNSIPLFGPIFLMGSLRRKTKRSSKKRALQFLILFAIAGAGCGGGSSGSLPNSISSNIGKSPMTVANGSGAITAANAHAAVAANSAKHSLAVADNLLGNHGSLSMAALAAPTSSPAPSNNSPLLIPKSHAASQASGGGGGGGQSGSASGAMATDASTHTSASASTEQGGPASDAIPASAYGGAGGGGGGGGGSSNPFASLTAGNSDGAARLGGESAFADRRPSSGLNGIGADEYFKLLAATDNLFKTVERRYQRESMDWAKEDATKALKSVRSLNFR